MKENSVRALIQDEMAEAGIIIEDGSLMSRFENGREYLVMLSVIDITDWNK